jgi:hypothetical protein
VMLQNMIWAWSEANDIERRVTTDVDATPEIKSEVLKAVIRLRDRAQAYAEKAAPYMHPKLHAVAPTLVREETEAVEVDPLREHLKEMAKFFNLPAPNGKAVA